jgi:hypothetical protein
MVKNKKESRVENFLLLAVREGSPLRPQVVSDFQNILCKTKTLTALGRRGPPLWPQVVSVYLLALFLLRLPFVQRIRDAIKRAPTTFVCARAVCRRGNFVACRSSEILLRVGRRKFCCVSVVHHDKVSVVGGLSSAYSKPTVLFFLRPIGPPHANESRTFLCVGIHFYVSEYNRA